MHFFESSTQAGPLLMWLYYTSALIVGQRNESSLLSIAQLQEVHLPDKGVSQSSVLTINSVDSACKQKCCKT